MSQTTGAGVVIRCCDGWFLLHGPRMLLVLSRDELVRALKRGKAWRRRAALTQRLGTARDGEANAVTGDGRAGSPGGLQCTGELSETGPPVARWAAEA